MSDYFNAQVNRVSNGVTARANDVNILRDETGAGFDLLPDPSVIKQGLVSYGSTGGTANAITVTMPFTQAVYTDGLVVVFKSLATNTGAVTVQVDGLGIKSLVAQNGDALVAGDIIASHIIQIRYNSTLDKFEMVGISSGVLNAYQAAAAASAAAALTSEGNAAASEAAAAASEAAAAASESAAAASEAAALTSEGNAAASEAAAAASEAAALTSEGNAAASETAAGISEGNAAASETAAAASAADALTSEGNAAASAAAALTSEGNAAASEAAALTSEGNAAASEAAALTSEGNAAASEAAAAASESKAELWAEELEDVEVEPGMYSARHWAIKAIENANPLDLYQLMQYAAGQGYMLPNWDSTFTPAEEPVTIEMVEAVTGRKFKWDITYTSGNPTEIEWSYDSGSGYNTLVGGTQTISYDIDGNVTGVSSV